MIFVVRTGVMDAAMEEMIYILACQMRVGRVLISQIEIMVIIVVLGRLVLSLKGEI